MESMQHSTQLKINDDSFNEPQLFLDNMYVVALR